MNKQANFKAGEKYEISFIGDSALRPLVQIVRRTEKSVWFVEFRSGKPTAPKRAKVSNWEGVEFFLPFGAYSMAPRVTADSKA